MVPCLTLSYNELFAILKGVTIFSGFGEGDLEYIRENCDLLEARIGEVVLEEGTPATEILIILKGRVTIVLNLEEEPIELIEFGPGSCIGETSVIGIQKHSASAVIIEDTILMVLKRQVLMQLFNDNKALFSLLILNIARELARRLSHTDEVLLHYGKMGEHHEILHPGIIKKLQPFREP